MRDVFLALGFAFFPTSIALTVMWMSARNRAQRAETIIQAIAMSGRYREDQAAAMPGNIGPALEALALEVERIAEGQRFTTRLLSERGESLPTYPRTNTPH